MSEDPADRLRSDAYCVVGDIARSPGTHGIGAIEGQSRATLVGRYYFKDETLNLSRATRNTGMPMATQCATRATVIGLEQVLVNRGRGRQPSVGTCACMHAFEFAFTTTSVLLSNIATFAVRPLICDRRAHRSNRAYKHIKPIQAFVMGKTDRNGKKIPFRRKEHGDVRSHFGAPPAAAKAPVLVSTAYCGVYCVLKMSSFVTAV